MIWSEFQKLILEINLRNIQSSKTGIAKLDESIVAHFQNEEIQLFAKAFGKPRLTEGGAFCAYYFESFMNRRPLQQLGTLLKKINPNSIAPTPNPGTELFFSTGSPLAIPCEEHLALFTLIKEIKLQLALSTEINWPWIDSAMTLISSWLRMNHEKEENCLFPHLFRLLNEK
ncbi:MAG: hypothetical protein WA160_10780 [Pseudobdellovibrio sp.]